MEHQEPLKAAALEMSCSPRCSASCWDFAPLITTATIVPRQGNPRLPLPPSLQGLLDTAPGCSSSGRSPSATQGSRAGPLGRARCRSRALAPSSAPSANIMWGLAGLRGSVGVHSGTHGCFPSLQEIDGKALLLLRSDMMMKYMGLKLGPALKLTYHIDKLKQGKF